jgi:hypothetical protein
MNLNGKKYTYNFFCVSKHPSPFPPEDEEVEGVDSLCFVETLRDPLQRAMENQANDQQDGELEETTKGLEPRFKTRRTRTPVKTITGKMSCSRLVVTSSDQFPTRGTPSDKSLPRTTSYSFARAVSASDPGASHTTWRDPGAGAPPPQRVGGGSPCHANTPAGAPQRQLAPTGALMRLRPAAQPSNHHHLQPCSTQAPPEALKHPLRRAQA